MLHLSHSRDNVLNSSFKISWKKKNSFMHLSLQFYFMIMKFGELIWHFVWAHIQRVLLNMLSTSIQVKELSFLPWSWLNLMHITYWLLHNYILFGYWIESHHMISTASNSMRYPFLAIKSSKQLASKLIH